jgi:hypothetical protein
MTQALRKYFLKVRRSTSSRLEEVLPPELVKVIY